VKITGADSTLDAAVAQTRVLLDRVRQGALTEDDRSRASAAVARSRLAASLDPRARVIALWRGDAAPPAPSLDSMKAFASTALHDESLVVVVSRPPRPEPPRPAKESRGRPR
jgi:hypothetical protein